MRAKTRDLTTGSIPGGLWLFAVPLMLGNVLQQLYNLVDTWVVGRYIGDNALAAVGSSYTLLTFLTSVVIGLSLGTGAYISFAFGRRDSKAIRSGIFMSFLFIGGLSLVIMAAFYALVGPVIRLLQVPEELWGDMHCYLVWVFPGFFATFLYNYVSNVLRGMGNSSAPLVFLAVAVVLNVGLDLYFVITLDMGIRGAAVATVIAQYVSGVGLLLYALLACPEYRVGRGDMGWDRERLRHILSLSGLTCLQQSMMNFGILLVQGVVNSFGPVVMAAFAVAVKIDTIAYMPVQDFGNAFSVFVAQNYGAGKGERIRAGIRQGAVSVAVFCGAVSTLVCLFAPGLMGVFVDAANQETIRAGVEYLRIEGMCYIGIGLLFMLYGYYRAVDKPMMSVVLTVLSLGTRVLLANVLAPVIGPVGVWAAIPIGWALADVYGVWYHYRREESIGCG
ncbi:MAG: MATE family efflux transporter [Acutalibacter sp.]|nr:MATE family efflux transporter [Acutalibacter sp.]